MANAFGSAGGAGRVQHDRDVVGATGIHFMNKKVRMVMIVRRAQRLHALKRMQPGLCVVAHAARVVIDDVRQPFHGRARLEQLVDLLLIFHHREVDAGVLEHVGHVSRRRILVQRNRDATERLRSGHRHVQAWPVVTNDCQVHAAAKAELGQPASKPAHLVGDLRPVGCLPDTEVFLAKGRALRAVLCMQQQ